MNSNTNTLHLATALLKRFQNLYKSGNRQQFESAMLSTISKQFHLPKQHPHLQPLLDRFLVMFDQAHGAPSSQASPQIFYQGRNTHSIMLTELQQFIKLVILPSVSAAIPTIADANSRQQYLDVLEENTPNTLERMLTDRFQVPQGDPVLTPDEQSLSDVLDLMREGRMTTAVNTIVRRFDPAVIDRILQTGVELFDIGLTNVREAQDRQKLLLHALLSRGVHTRTVDLGTITTQQITQLTLTQQQRRQAGGIVCSPTS
ncbi:hypothetical protein BGX34_005832 [Mortierella sp. NVP85]|nr:hypothetical protein BGX34_005832 [Mortierella sp. NVP85]